MEEKENVNEEIINLQKEIKSFKDENKELKRILSEQALEIEKLKEVHIKDKSELLNEIKALKEYINSTISNKNIDNAPPLCNTYLTPISSKGENKFGETPQTEKGEYITSISFFLSNSVDLCLAQLLYYGYQQIEGDIRKDSGGLYCILGCKYEKNQPYITNILGSVSESEEPAVIYENGIQYNVVKDPLNNADIHKGSGGNYLCLYYTKDPKAGKPIKNLKTLSTKEKLNDQNIVKYCSRKTRYNKPFEPLDCNRGRDNIFIITPQNYIFIIRD